MRICLKMQQKIVLINAYQRYHFAVIFAGTQL